MLDGSVIAIGRTMTATFHPTVGIVYALFYSLAGKQPAPDAADLGDRTERCRICSPVHKRLVLIYMIVVLDLSRLTPFPSVSPSIEFVQSIVSVMKLQT